jgi:erythromycin esterase
MRIIVLENNRIIVNKRNSIFLRLIVVLSFLSLLTSCSRTTSHSQFLNLDFEESTNGQASGWYQGGKGYTVSVDTLVSYSGNKGLRIKQVFVGQFGVARSSFPIDDAKGKHLRYTGFIKTENITSGFASLWWRVDGSAGILNFDNMDGRGAKGTTDWTKYTIELDIDKNANSINFGVGLAGNGTAWFDKLKIELDGEIYEQKQPKINELSFEQSSWLNDNVFTFKTSDPRHSNDDLRFLNNLIGDAKIVSLGEGTHGTSEFFKIKHRIIKYLAEEMGFTVFAIEANMPESKLLNDYILNGKGDAKKLLAGLYFWTWNTKEVLDMIEWMREFNVSGKGRIEFWGFDMQLPNVAINNVEDFLKEYDPTYLNKAKENYKNLIVPLNEMRKLKPPADDILFKQSLNANEVYNYVLNNKKSYEKKIEKNKVEWMIMNAKIVLQSVEYKMQNKTSRDESMANNAEWILNQFPKNTKMVLWAHNGHVSKMGSDLRRPMGYYLDQKYGKNMIVFGFGFNEGTYTAVGNMGLAAYSTSKSHPGSLEWILHSADKERMILDLRKIPKSPLFAILKDEIEFRSIGAIAKDEAFYKTKILDEYDAIIYFDKSTPSTILAKAIE